jgi:hypothetical protein
MTVKVTAAEALLSEAWGILMEKSGSQEITVPECNALFGRISSRVVLFMLRKQKDGPECTAYMSFTEIKDAFQAELGCPQQSGPAASSSSAASDIDKVATVAETSDPIWIAGQKGFQVGLYFIEKTEDAGLFKLIKFDHAGATFEGHSLGPSEPTTKVVSFDDLKVWSRFTRKIPELVQAPIASWMADGHAALSKEATKAHMFTQLVELAEEHAGNERAVLPA